MMRYVLLNVLVFVALLLWVRNQKLLASLRRQVGQTMASMSALTIIFDPLIIAAGIVAYNRQYTLGINFWHAPVEDLFYALAAAVLIPLLWKQYEKR